jgi:hypothetical protein
MKLKMKKYSMEEASNTNFSSRNLVYGILKNSKDRDEEIADYNPVRDAFFAGVGGGRMNGPQRLTIDYRKRSRSAVRG